jgi:hypothetical protein
VLVTGVSPGDEFWLHVRAIVLSQLPVGRDQR